MAVRVPSNSIARWRDSLRGMKPQPQVIGYWLIEQADDGGVVDGVDWEKLSQATGVTITTLRRELRDGELITSGKVVREPRQWGNTFGATRYVLHIPDSTKGST